MIKRRHALFLQLLHESTPKERKSLLNSVGNDFYKFLSEIIFNILYGNVPIHRSKISRLRKYKQTLHTLSDRSVSLDRKRHLLHQHSGGSLLHILCPILASIVGNLL